MLQGFSWFFEASRRVLDSAQCRFQEPVISGLAWKVYIEYRKSWTNSVTPHPQLYTTISTTKRAKTKACVMSP